MAKQAVCDECGTVRPVDEFGGLPRGWLKLIERVKPAHDANYSNDFGRDLCGFGCVMAVASRAHDLVVTNADEARAAAGQLARDEAREPAGELYGVDGERIDGGEAGHVRAALADCSDE